MVHRLAGKSFIGLWALPEIASEMLQTASEAHSWMTPKSIAISVYAEALSAVDKIKEAATHTGNNTRESVEAIRSAEVVAAAAKERVDRFSSSNEQAHSPGLLADTLGTRESGVQSRRLTKAPLDCPQPSPWDYSERA